MNSLETGMTQQTTTNGGKLGIFEGFCTSNIVPLKSMEHLANLEGARSTLMISIQ